jgi:hypothetical protein
MIELFVYLAILSLFAGIVLGWFRMLWLLANFATAGAAALAAQAGQCFGPWAGALCRGMQPAAVRIDGMVYVEIVVLATLGWAFGRWRRDVEG